MNFTPSRILLDIGFLLLMAACAGWVAWHFLCKAVDPAKLVFKWIVSAGLIAVNAWLIADVQNWVLPILILPAAISLGLIWAPSIGAIMGTLMSGSMDGGDVAPDAQPFYSIAEAKRRNGHPLEAIAAVRQELEKFPGDFHGTMLLASILAEDMNDLPGAQIALERWINGPASTPHGMASALTALADWHLQFAQDRDAARAALERIVQALPDTPIAHRAAQRLAHLPTAEFLMSARSPTPLNLRPGEKDIGLLKDYKDYKGPSPPKEDPDALVEEYVKQLEKHPADTATREKLAVLYADHFHRLDLAVDQLEQLIAFRNETPRNIVHWLNLLADLHIRCGKDLAAAKAALLRIIEQFPSPALSEPATARLAALEGELRGGRPTPLKTLGHYEKNLGLKKA
jgi:tetratricopeptide (TPR) repeat protein